MRAPLPRSCVVCAARTNGASRCPRHAITLTHGDTEYQRNRAAAVKRDHARCQRCGRGPADGIPIHVDHITELRDGGTHALANLEVLCLDHHNAKTYDR